MSTPTEPARFPHPRDIAWAAVPIAATLALLLAFGFAGPRDPAFWLVVGPLAVATLVLALARTQLLVLWLVPVSMCVHVYLPVLHYEALTLLLGGALLLGAWSAGRPLARHLEPVEWRYLVFLASLLPGIAVASSLWRFGAALKVYIVGLVAFEVARHASRRFGPVAMLLGPAALAVITAAQLAWRVAGSGIPGFRSVEMRVYLSDLSWGTSNYVAAVLVLCLPALLLIHGATRRTSWRRWAGLGALAAALAGVLVTTSRGGAVIAGAYLVSLLAGLRRRLGIAVAILAVLGGALAMTPFGQGLVDRFTSQRGFDSLVFRVFIWQNAFMRGWDHLPFGLGAGQGLITNDRLQQIDAHNFLLTLFSESGALAVAAWVWMAAALVGRARRLAAHDATRARGVALGATLSVAFANMLFEPTLVGNLYHLQFWWLTGTLYGADDGVDGRPPAPAAR
jgi:hypothetical protein